MIVELECISQLPLPEPNSSITNYVPQRVFQKKLFVIENLHIEEHVNSKGIVKHKFTTCKYDGEYYKLNTPYKTLRDNYYTPIVVRGLRK